MKTVIKKIMPLLLMVISLNTFSQNATTTTETNDMQFMLEEEKLARDVYEFLADKWNLKVFNNIKISEQKHMNIMEELLTSNHIENYKVDKERGVFFNKELQTLYDDLVKKGSKSITDALEVGKLIEEKDIYDLEIAIKNTSNEYSKQVYSNLLKASQNHLRAFNRQFDRNY